MTQPNLFPDAPVDPGPAVVCAFGTPWARHVGPPGCAACAAESDRLAAAFAAAVAAGEYDAQGYTPAERRAQRTRP
jgi:hypothetical protein